MSIQRIESLRKKMRIKGIDGLFVIHRPNLEYLLNIDFSIEGACLITYKDVYFLTDFCNFEEAKEKIKNARVVFAGKKLVNLIDSIAGQDKVKKLGIEHQYLSIARYNEIKKAGNIEIVYAGGMVEELRMFKERSEIENIRKACELTTFVFFRILNMLRPGMTEKEVARRIEGFIRENGGEIAFETIVASGLRSGYPHGTASDKSLCSGDAVIIDFGVRYKGYHSDFTRTIFVGKPGPLERKIYNLIRCAQEKAIEKIKDGIFCSAVDLAARSYIIKKGYGKNFGHSLGHGVGKEVHELPGLSRKSKVAMKAGMVVAVEPGIYIPGGFGVRIEDTVLVTDEGAEILTDAPRNIILI